MKATITRRPLFDAVKSVAQAAAVRTTKPALTQVRCEIRPETADRLTLSATDNEVGIRTDVFVTDARPGVVLVPPKKLQEIISEGKDAPVEIEQAGTLTGVKVAGGRFSLTGADPAEFPEVTPFDAAITSYLTVAAGPLRGALRRVIFACDKTEVTARFAVSGLLFQPEADKLIIVGTDTKRLSLDDVPAAPSKAFAPSGRSSHLLPRKACQLVLDNLPDDDAAEVRIHLAAGEALVRFEETTIQCRLLEGRFPPYRDIIPKKWACEIPLRRDALLSATRRAAVAADDESKAVDFTFGAGECRVRAESAKTGTAEIDLPLPGYAGPDLNVRLYPDYVTELLRSVDAPELLLRATDNNKPLVFVPRDGGPFLHLIMPITKET